jgi:hypothetical protein
MSDTQLTNGNRFDNLPRPLRIALGLLIGCLLLLLAGLMFEILLRLYYRRPIVERYFNAASNTAGYGLQSSLRYEYLHNGKLVTVSTDSQGRRIVPGDSAQAARTVYVIGDSQVFGWGLNDFETIPGRLQQKLGSQWRVVNLGVPGYGPFQYAEQMSTLKDGVVLVIQTEANDLQDAYVPRPPVLTRCGYLVPRGWLGTHAPCSLLSSYSLAKYVEVGLWISPRTRIPLGFNPHSQVAARVLSYRIKNLYSAALEKRSSRVIFAVIPWDAAIDTGRLSNYEPRLSRAERYVELPDDSDLERDFLRHSAPGSLFQKGDAHLSEVGADLVAEKLATVLLKELEK